MNLTEWNKLLAEHRAAIIEARAEIRALRLRLGSVDDMLRLRSAALDRTAAQLAEVRKLHVPEQMTTDVKTVFTGCKRCGVLYPCLTAKAAGVTP